MQRVLTTLAALGGAGFGLISVLPAQTGQQANDRLGASANLFRTQCASCHVVPDLRFDVEKAWLGQIRETA